MKRAAINLFTLGFALLAACESTPKASDAGALTDAAIVCPATADPSTWGPGTTHDTTIDAPETWTAAGSPHRVTDVITVNQPLTIEPCAVVLLDPSSSSRASLTVQSEGRLLAEGTAASPILIRGLPRADGSRVGNTIDSITATGEAIRLAHVTMEGGGETTASLGDYMLTLQGSGSGTPKTLHVDHVTLRDGYGGGIYLSKGDRFSADSTDLTVTGMRATSGLSADHNMTNDAPVRFAHPDSVGSLPSGDYTGNTSDHIAVSCFGCARVGVTETATWRDPGVPYFMRSGIALEPSASNPTLTLEAGVTLRWTTGTSTSNRGTLRVGYAPMGTEKATLIVAGTAENVVTMEGVTEQPGAWSGIAIYQGGVDTRLDHLLLRHAGLETPSAIIDCSGLGPRFGIGVNVASGLDVSPDLIRNTTVQDAAADTVGIMRGWSIDEAAVGLAPDYLAAAAGNTVTGLSCRQSGFQVVPPSGPPTCSTTCE